jgi:phosphohistidine phosphatase SixA
VFDVDPVALLTREVLRERTPALVAETCAWSVGLSDAPHHVRRHGRVVSTGQTLGMRAAAAQQLSVEEDLRLELGEPVPGSFADALGALTADGGLQADRFDAQVLTPFVLDTCVEAARRARDTRAEAWEELLEDLGEDGDDLTAVVRAAEWDAPLRTDAEQLVLAAVGHAPLVEVEAEGLPLSLVRAAEAETRRAAGAEPVPPPRDEDLAGALFLADVALTSAGLPQPVPPDRAGQLLEALLGEGLQPEEVLAVLPHLPVLADTADAVAGAVDLGRP